MVIEHNPPPEDMGLENTEPRERTKQEAQAELRESFGLSKTSDFQAALRHGKIDLCKQWLQHIVDNKNDFPQYEETWDSWLADRQYEIKQYSQMQKSGELEKIDPNRTKELAQQELVDRFGLKKTSDFQAALKRGNIDLCKQWLQHIIDNKKDFPQYLATWEAWLVDRQGEIDKAENK